MSVIIKGYVPADKCIDCRLMVIRDNDDCIVQTDEANEKSQSWDDMKKGCPLVVLLEHGRLINADLLKEKLWALIHDEKFPMIHITGIMAAIDATPAVVEEERSEAYDLSGIFGEQDRNSEEKRL